MIGTAGFLSFLMYCFLYGFTASSAETPSLGLVYKGGKITTDPVTISLLWFGPEWRDPDKETVRNAIDSLTSMRYGSDFSREVPTLENWWDVIRQYRDSSGFSVTDTVNVGPECSYIGPHVNMTLDQVSEIAKATFNRSSIEGFGKSLICNEFFSLADNSLYHVLFSDAVTFLDGTEQRNFTDMCSGSFPVEASKDEPVSMNWVRAPWMEDDQCSILSYSKLYKGSPNGNEKVDSLVGNLLGKIAEEVTNRDGRGWTSIDGNGLSVSSSCVSRFDRSIGAPLYTDINRSFSFNAVGLNGHRYILPYIFDQNIKNCVLNLSEACTTKLVVLKQPSGYLRVGIGVNHSDGLQPYFPNQQCKWKIEIPKAKFLSFSLNYFSVAQYSDDLLQVCPSDSTSSADECIVINANTKDPTNFKLMGPQAYVKFVSGDSVSIGSRGWEIRYNAGICSGKEDLYKSSGFLGYDVTSNSMSYVEGLHCRWVLHGKPGTGVSLSFTRINISKNLDFIAIFSDTSQEILNFTGAYDGMNLPRVNLTGKVTIMFSTQTDDGEGWSANYYMSSPENPRKGEMFLLIVLGSLAIVVSFSIVIFVVAMIRGRMRSERNITHVNSNQSFQLNGSNILREENRIGEGHSAVVYRAVVADGSSVAVKSFRHEGYRMQLEQEILLKASCHRNIVSLLGPYEDEFPGCFMVFELMSRGSLSYNLRKKGETLRWEQRLDIALQVSSAIQMLHMYMKPPVFHGNITSENVLLDEFCNAKLGGFGCARYCNANDPTDKGGEILETAEDLWSFGILLLELLAGKPLPNRNDHRRFGSLDEMNEITGDREFIDQRLGLPCDDCKIVALAKFGDIAKWCISGILSVDRNDEKPKIGDVLSGLQQVKQLYCSVPR